MEDLFLEMITGKKPITLEQKKVFQSNLSSNIDNAIETYEHHQKVRPKEYEIDFEDLKKIKFTI